MKKLLFLTAAAAVAFSSCTKDQTEVVSIESKDGVRISASMVESTRTYLGDDKFYHWSKGDALGVFVKDNANNAKNVAFTLDPIYDGQINGEFVSNNTDLLDAATEEFFAYYPHTPGMKAEDVLDLDLQVLSEQNYQPGTFATLTAPSVADDFTLAEPVEMQPVADYLKVRINGVEDINYLTLAIKYNGGWLNLTDVELKKYLVKANANVEDEDADVRYALVPKSFEGTPAETEGGTTTEPCDNPYHFYDGKHMSERWTGCDGTKEVSTPGSTNNPTSTITLNCGRLDETVVCHNDNEYVFVIPAGILRSESGTAVVYLGVNHDLTEGIDLNSGYDFMFPMPAKTGMTTGKVADILAANKPESTIKLENYIHNVNDGKAITFNPTGKFIIHNEIDFLQYMNEYGVPVNFVNGINQGGLGYVDAYVCGPIEDDRNNEVTADYEFNFTTKNINDLATSFKGKENEAKYNKYVSDYIANGIPCIREYRNAFEANGATFKAIKGLQSKNGMFGKLEAGARVENFFLKDIKGAAAVEAPAHDYAKPNVDQAYAILASSVADGASIKNIDIENASYANCILAAGDVDDVKEIEIVANEVLPYVINDFSLEKDWTVAPEKYLVDQLFVFTTAVNGHNVITVAESADAKATYNMFGKIDATRGDSNCVSVVINNESWWTKDTIAPAAKQTDETKPNFGYVEIAYAEQLKYGASAEKIALTRNMQMNGFDWETAVVAPEINGNGNTIYGITWSLEGENLSEINDSEDSVAPFAANTIKKLTVEGQTFNFVTDGTNKGGYGKVYMPSKIAGLTISAEDVQDVKINNFVIFAKDAEDASESIFNDVKPYYSGVPSIGWAVVNSTNGLFKNVEVNVTSSNVKGEAALINTIELTADDEAQVIKSQANVAAMAQSALNGIVAYDADKHNNVAGAPVFKVVNESGAARSIKFFNCGTLAMTYNQPEVAAATENKINVLDNDVLVGTYNCFVVEE